MKAFWIVMADRAQLVATMRHPDESSARREAERLAKLHPDTRFYVAAVYGVAEAVSVRWEVDTRTQMPF